MTGTEIRSAMIQARDEYIDIIRSELLGPGSEFSWPDKEHELISSTPTSRYSLGILFPQGNEHGQDNDETLQKDEEGIPEEEVIREYHDTANDPSQSQQQHTFEIDDTADENLDEEIGMATQYWPSSMGITFLVKGEATVVKGRLSFATYRGAGISDCAIPYTPDSPELYQVPTELAHIMEFDKNAMVLKLKSRVTPQEVRSIFERDTLPENEHRALENIHYLRCGNIRTKQMVHPFCHKMLHAQDSETFEPAPQRSGVSLEA